MGLYKRNDAWCIQYFANGKRVRESIGPSKREAQLVLGKRQAAIREGRYFDVERRPDIAFGVLGERYLKEYVEINKKPRSALRRAASTKVLVAFFGADTVARKIQPADVSAFVQKRKAQGRAGATVNAELGHLGHLFNWAIRLNLVSANPVKGTPQLKFNKKERYLSTEEVMQLLASLIGDLHDMALVALATGMRADEIANLDREHVDLKQGVAALPDTKNGSRRDVPLPPQAVDMFQRRPVPLHEWFPGWTYKNLSMQFSRAAKHAGLANVTFHTLRHTFASHAVMAGVDLYTLAKLLGHRDIKMVQRYAHLAPSHLKTAATIAASAIFADNMPPEMPQFAEKVA